MPEPLDTIRRVNSDQPMNLEELQRARATLDQHSRKKKTDVLEARRRVGDRIEKVTGAPAAASNTAPSGTVRHASIQDSIYSGSVRPPAPSKSSGGSSLGGFLLLLLIVGGVVYGCSRSGSSDSDTGGADSSGADSGSSAAMQEAETGAGQVSRAELEAVGRTCPRGKPAPGE